MTQSAANDDLSATIGTELPYLRRYARALTGSQDNGDRYAMATLEALVEDRTLIDRDLAPRVALFKVFSDIWSASGTPVALVEGNTRESLAQARLAKLTPNSREALLMRTVEGMTTSDISAILGIDLEEAENLIDTALDEMADTIRGDVLVIEDEAIIAVDISSIVTGMGHRVTSTARTRSEAVRMAVASPPDLVLADVQLADKSSGIDAVSDIQQELGERPVIFITAFPERLLTGSRLEPAFLISKPYTEEQVRSAVSQAMFFASTVGMDAAR